MPNLCENDVYIEKSPEFLESKLWGMLHFSLYGRSADSANIKVMEVIDTMNKDECGILGAVIPIGDGGDYKSPHEARIELWGTKWDVVTKDIDVVNIDEYDIRIRFLTAWSPPCPWAKKVSELYRTKVEITYGEPGMNFSGYCSYIYGEEMSNEEGEYGEFNTEINDGDKSDEND